MNPTVCVALLFVGMVFASPASDLAASSKACSAEFNISGETLTALRAAADKSSFPATDDLKCYTKCVIDRTGFLNVESKSLNLERIVDVSVAIGRQESAVRGNADKCTALYDGSNDCAQSYNLYACFFQ